MKPLYRSFPFVFVLFLCLLLIAPWNLFAQDHVVSPADLQNDVAAASASRQKEVEQLESLFSSPQANRALKSAHVTYHEVDEAVRQLDDEDLAALSARSQAAQNDFAGGTISNRDLLIIIVAILALVLIIVAVR